MELLDVLDRHRSYHPEKTAVIGSSERLTYRLLADQADHIADLLREARVSQGWRVALMLPNDTVFLAAYAGVRRAGGVVVPINLRLAVEEVLHQLEHSQASLLIVDDTWAHILELRRTARPPVISTDGGHVGTMVNDLVGTIGRPPLDDCPPEVERIMYTSGTTSRPKGVLLTSDQIHWGALTRCVDFALTAADVTLTVAPLYHVGGLDSFTTPLLLAGGTVVLCPGFDPGQVLHLLREHRVTCTWLAPTLLRELFRMLDQIGDVSLPALRVVLGGGEKAPITVLRRLAELWPQAGYYDAYGLTECQGVATYLPASHAASHRGSVGRPAIAREVTVVDDDGRPSRPGQYGEIRIAGPVVTPGYWQDTQATADAFDGKWLRTGDIGVLDEDGFLHIVDRKKDMIRSGLENVASSEIERVLHSCPGIVEAAVVARPDDRWGEVPIAFIVVDQPSDLAELRRFCEQRLARFKVPAAFHITESLPRTASGKVQKNALRTRTLSMEEGV